METLKSTKVLTVLLCINLLETLSFYQNTTRKELCSICIAHLRYLLRELNRDLTSTECTQVKRGFWRSYQKFRIPRWLHSAYVDVLRTPPIPEKALDTIEP